MVKTGETPFEGGTRFEITECDQMFMFFAPMYFVFLLPAMLLTGWAQMKVRSAYREGQKVPSKLSGAAAARYILDQAGLQDVGIEETRGMLSDHYDPSQRVLRLSHEVYHAHSAISVGIAAHEAGHALQHAQNYAPLVLRNAAVPAARVGPVAFFVLLIAGMIFSNPALIYIGIACFGAVAVFQIINLPVEFDASNRAKRILTEYGIVDGEGGLAVKRVLNAAGWTYVAATLQTVLTLLYYIFRFSGGFNSRD